MSHGIMTMVSCDFLISIIPFLMFLTVEGLIKKINSIELGTKIINFQDHNNRLD
jgi:hypothetical protein